jgi:biotin synthase
LSADEDSAEIIFAEADRVRHDFVGDDIHLRALIEIGNYCRQDCLYCGIRSSRRDIERYRLSASEIIALANMAYSAGYRSTVIQGGEDLYFTKEMVGEIIRAIKINDMAITLSLGERDIEDYAYWKECGADDLKLFAYLHPTGNLEQRKQAIYNLQSLGYQTGSGIMIGLPGQTPEMVANDIIWLYEEAKVSMLGIGPFIPHESTPLRYETGGTLFDALKLIAVLRLVFKSAHIPATTALGAICEDGREQALMAGANVIMPNITPLNNREQYEIYPGKLYNIDDAAKNREDLIELAKKLGRKISDDRGDTVQTF